MTIDLSKFKDIYLQESREGLDTIESVLIGTPIATLQPDQINEIFRAAHSIKGGSGTFGFKEIGELTHDLETYLDFVRDGKITLSEQGLDLVLQSVDAMRHMLDDYTASETTAYDYSELLKSIQILYADSSTQTVEENVVKVQQSQDPELRQWHIELIPNDNLFLTGNDPLNFIRELEELGDANAIAKLGRIPSLENFNFESCYISWEIDLVSDCQSASIEEIFDWIVDDCTIKITETDFKSQLNDDSQLIESVTAKSDENKEATATKSSVELASIRVNVDKIDRLLNMVGELVITQSMLSQAAREEFDESDSQSQLKKGLSLLVQNTRELQECVMSIRMVPISYAFDRLPRTVYDISKQLEKKVSLDISGGNTELDKTVMQQLTDPLTHLVRNAVDHGIELPEIRRQKNKSETGYISLNAYHQSGNIIITISDDGAGLNRDKILKKAVSNGIVNEDDNLSDADVHQLIFHPGLSTAEAVTNISGRGVGMDVVQKNIRALGGSIDIISEPDKGSTISIQLPLTLAIVDGQLLLLNQQIFIVPIASIIETLQMDKQHITSLSGRADLYRLREEYIPIIKLAELFKFDMKTTELDNALLVVVESGEYRVGLLIDELLEQQQVVLKSLEDNYEQIEGISGATILGNGKIALILDIPGIIRIARCSNAALFSNFKQDAQQHSVQSLS